MKYDVVPIDPETLAAMQAESEAVLEAIRESVREAVIRHKRLGLPMVSWENGRVVWIPADQLPDYERPLAQCTSGPLSPRSFCPTCQENSFLRCSCVERCACQNRV